MSTPFMMESRKGQGGIENTSPWGGVSGWTAWLYAGEVTIDGHSWVTPPKLIVRGRRENATYRRPVEGDILEITAPLELRNERRLEPDAVVGHLRDTDRVEVLEVVQIDASSDSKGVWARVRSAR
jgi:hypothetical protein